MSSRPVPPSPLYSVHIVGFGSQATAWSECLRDSGWDVRVYLRPEGASWERAKSHGFVPREFSALRELEGPSAQIALLIPDHEIGAFYQEHLAPSPIELDLILAHGYAVFSGDLAPANPRHHTCLLAPKAIGPKLRAAYLAVQPTHPLVAGFFAPSASQARLRSWAHAMGFSDGNLVVADFSEEAIGDLISEQGLLCGSVFNFLEWTMEAMSEAGVPDGLIREECLTELELIAGMIRERGPAATFGAISQAAQCGTIAMRRQWEKCGAKRAFQNQVEEVISRKFNDFMRSGEWVAEAKELRDRLEKWQNRLRSPRAGAQRGETVLGELST